MDRALRLQQALTAYFSQHPNNRALGINDWKATRHVTSVLDEAALVTKMIQGGSHAFVAQAINDLAILHASVTASTQEIRSSDPNGLKQELAVPELVPEARQLLTILAEDMQKRDLGSPTTVGERINLVLDPRYKSCCAAVCLNGGVDLQELVRADTMTQFYSFQGDAPGKSATGEGSAAGGEGATGGSVAPSSGAAAPSPAPASAPLSRMARIRAQKSKEVARPEDAQDGPETRYEAGMREFSEYMKEVALNDDDPNFSLLQYWKLRASDGLDRSLKVSVPARWPHVGLVARLFAGMDTTSCEAERNFSALALVVSDLRASMSPRRVEQTLFLRLNKYLIPGVEKALRDVNDLKNERRELVKESVAAKNTSAGGDGDVTVVS